MTSSASISSRIDATGGSWDTWSAKTCFASWAARSISLGTRTPWNETLGEILQELYTPDEADLITRMPYGLSTLRRLAAITGEDQTDPQEPARPSLRQGPGDGHRDPGEIPLHGVAAGHRHFRAHDDAHRPRPRPQEDRRSLPPVHGPRRRLSRERTSAHGETSHHHACPAATRAPSATKTTSRSSTTRKRGRSSTARTVSRWVCARAGTKSTISGTACDAPMDNCSSMGYSADYLIRHDLAREVSKAEMLDNVDRSRDLGSGDECRQRPTQRHLHLPLLRVLLQRPGRSDRSRLHSGRGHVELYRRHR